MFNFVRATIAWVSKQLLLLSILVVAIVLFQLGIVSSALNWASGVDFMTPSEAQQSLELKRAEALENFDLKAEEYKQGAAQQLEAEISFRKARLEELRGELAAELSLWDQYNPSAILDRKSLELELQLTEEEVSILENRLDLLALQEELNGLQVPTERAIEAARRQCADANKDVRAFNNLWLLEREYRNRTEGAAASLTETAMNACNRVTNLERRRAVGLQAASDRLKLRNRLEQETETVTQEARERLETFSATDLGIDLSDVLLKAVLTLVVIIATPFLIRTIFYYLIAPIAERKGLIQIDVPGNLDEAILSSSRSKVSLAVELKSNEELLVRQGFLQTTGAASDTSTRWLLDYRHPFTSLASGLFLLTRIRGERELTTISATDDPLAEVVEVDLQEGASCVLHSRALVAVRQPIGRPIRARSHWRIFSLNAWLTMQLRYLSFSGPGSLIVKGGRGIRVEHAREGRIFSQDQLVGFSADLSYSVTRTETFIPYLLGKVSLLKDKVHSGTGVVIIEEAPLSARTGKGVRSGLEGAFDASLKAFGV